MGLSLELNAKLDASGPLLNLEGNIMSSLGDFDLVSIPDFSGEFSIANSNHEGINLSLITQGVQQVLSNLNPVVGNLSGSVDIQSISKVLELASQLSDLDIPNSLEKLQADFASGLAGNDDFLAKLGNFSEIINGNLSIQSAKEFIESLVDITGSNIDLNQFNMVDLLPAFDSIVKLIGNLMSIWNRLEEGGKLAKVVQAQLDHERINAAIVFIEKQLGAGGTSPLVDFLRELDISDESQVAAAKHAIANVKLSVNGLHNAIAEGMAFGEATLVQLNPSDLKLSVQKSALEMGSLDVGKLEGLVQQLADQLQPLFMVDFGQAPVESLDGWLTLLEGKTSELADDIAAYNIEGLMSPITQGLEAVLAIPAALNDALQKLKLELQQELNSIRDAVQSVPVDTLVDTIQRVLAPITTALNFISELIAEIQAVLGSALTALQAALDTAENAVDSVKDELEQVFLSVKSYIDSLALDEIIGEVAQQIQAFANALGQADMAPYFDAVTDVIITTTDVVDKVPFDLLPDSMEQELVELVKPVKEVDLEGLENDIKNLLQIGDDGTFELRPDLEAVLSSIQGKYDEILAVVAQGDPQAFAEQINQQLAGVQDKIAKLTPTVALEPIQQAIDTVTALLAGFDLEQALAPLNNGFDQVLEKVDEFKPSILLEELENTLAETRQSLFADLQLDSWTAEIVSLRQQILDLLEPLDPNQIEPLLQQAVDEIKQQAANLPTKELAYLIGSFISGVLGGRAGQSRADSFAIIFEWMRSGEGTRQLVALANQASAQIDTAFQATQQIDLIQIIVRLQPQLGALTLALNDLADGPIKSELALCINDLSIDTRLTGFVGLQERYLSALQQASSDFTELANEGLSEVDISVRKLQQVFQPLAFAKTLFVDILTLFGITDLDKGIQQFVSGIFDVATPARLAGIVTPIVSALKDRLADFVDAFLNPILDGVSEIQALEAQLSLNTLIVELDAIHQATREQITKLHPNKILGVTKTSFNQTQSDVLAFNPLGPLTAAIDELKDSSTRVLGKLDAEEILKTPTEVFQDVLTTLEMIDLQNLLKPILDVLDSLSQKVSQGLDDTTEAFKRLQDALPDQIGSTSISASVSASS
jgi:hypothetical protein